MSVIQSITNEVISPGRRANRAWFGASLAVAPGWGKGGGPEVVLCTQNITGCDIGSWFWMRTSDLAARWTPPYLSQTLIGSTVADDPAVRRIADDGEACQHAGVADALTADEHLEYVDVDCGPYYHRATDSILALGGTYVTRDGDRDIMQKNRQHVRGTYVRDTVMAVWDRELGDFKPWKRVAKPACLADNEHVSIVGISQWVEADDGTIYIPADTGVRGTSESPIYPGITILRCEYDGEDFRFVEQGATVSVDEPCGLCEPSLAEFQGRYYLTMRHNLRGYVAVGDDPMAMGEARPWTMDDGQELGNYRTMTHWLTRDDALYLVYNRTHDLNNGVFRGRAPLFIAQVDPEKLCVIRDTEQVVIPENGARLGNFAVVNVSDDESWIVSGEWLVQDIGGYKEGMPFWADIGEPSNRMQYIGDLLLARVKFV